MDSLDFNTDTIKICMGLFLVVVLMCGRLLQTKRYLLLLLWPALIYFPGPAITSVFSSAPVLKAYVFPETVVPETLVMFSYIVFFMFLDKWWDLSANLQAAFNSQTMTRVARSPAFLLLYTTIALVASFLQCKVLIEVGSIFTGSYILNSVAEGLIPYWGFLAGLYELIFLCFVMFLLSGQQRIRFLVFGIYIFTALLRVAGGTRLILIKEIAVICILFYFRGSVKRLHLVLVGSAILLMGTAIGLVRNNGDDLGNGFGPFFGVAMESGLDALTQNVAYHVQDTGYLVHHESFQFLKTTEYVALSAIPSFLRLGVSQADLDALSPYGAALDFGFESAAPVGGMSGFATLEYFSEYPLVTTLSLVFVMALLIKLAPSGNLKNIAIVVLTINAIHFWRDPVDIAFKNVTQDIVCALVFLFLPAYSAVNSARSVTTG